MKINKITIQNFKNIANLEIPLGGKSIYLLGSNQSGKSSFLQAIEAALKGTNRPPVPVTAGAKSGFAAIELKHENETYTVNWKFTNTDPAGKLEVIIDGKSSAKAPREFLKALVGDISFDPMRFARLKPKEQADELRKIMQLDFTALDAERNSLYAERTAIGRDADNLKGFIMRSDISPDRARELLSEPIPSVESFDAEISGLEQYAKIEESARNDAEGYARAHTEAQGQLSLAMAALKANDERVLELEKQAGELRAKSHELSKAVASAESSVSEAANHSEAAAHNLSEAKQRNEVAQSRVYELRQQKAGIQSVLDGRKRAEAVLAEEQSYLAKQADYDGLTERIANIDEQKKQLVANAKCPVDGLEFGDDGLVYNGLPLIPGQVNTAKLIEVGVKLGMAINPALRILTIEDGSLLDHESRAALNSFITEHDYQAFIEIVSDDKSLKYEYTERETA